MVGLPGAGKTTRAREIAAASGALRLTPDDWMLPLFGPVQPDGRRDVLEGRLVTVALAVLRLGTDVVLDFGLWGRDERSALRSLAASAGASCRVVYLPVDPDLQLARIAHRQATAPGTTFAMSAADADRWRAQFQAPDAAELAGTAIPGPPPGWPSWAAWAVDRWPSLDPGRDGDAGPAEGTPVPDPHRSSECPDRHDLVRDLDGPGPRPEIVVLCGSTRFREEFRQEHHRLTTEGCIVLSPAFGTPAEDAGATPEEKARLGELHRRRIDLADRVLVIDPGGYVGDSTRGEIAYAERLGRAVEYRSARPVAPAARGEEGDGPPGGG